ncbi:MAG: SRPBCC family protein [Bacteroidia bacterium]
MKIEPIIIERTFNAPISAVWKAITDIKEMKKWYFNVSGFKPELGFEFQFEGRTKENAIKIHLCKVVDVVEGKKIAYSWKYKSHAGISFVTFELFAEGNSTRLRLTHTGIETIAVNGPGFEKENFVQGWTYIIGTSLKEFLEK